MKADQLQAFCAAAKFKSITRAAEALGSNQPRVSRQLSALQVAVGETLYERTAYGIALTSAGEAFLPYACAVAQTMEQLSLYVSNRGSRLRLRLRIGLSHSLVPDYTPRLLKRAEGLTRHFPNVRLNLTEGYSETLIEQVLQRQLDAAFVVEPYSTAPQPLIRRRYSGGLIGLLVKAEHSLAEQTMVSLVALQGETLILPAAISSIHKRVQACLARGRISPAKTVEVSGPAAVLAAVRQGLGVGIMLRNYLPGDLSHVQERFIQIEENGFVIGAFRMTHDLSTLEPAKRDALELLSAFPGRVGSSDYAGTGFLDSSQPR